MRIQHPDLISRFQPCLNDKILSVEDLFHKGNNRLYKVSLSKRDLLLKEYSLSESVAPTEISEGRGEREFKTLTFLRNRGITTTPYPISFHPEENIGIYSFERGKRLLPNEITVEDIVAAASFISQLHRIKDFGEPLFPPARSACLTLQDYSKILDFRLKRLKRSANTSTALENARAFLDDIVTPGIEKIKSYFHKNCARANLPEQLADNHHVLTPGDFGFHNILVDRTREQYRFLDFEYFGRDDPVRQILDFIHHDSSRGIKEPLKSLFVRHYRENTPLDSHFDERLNLLNPLIGATWVLIYLNILSPEYRSHLSFAHGGSCDVIDERYQKAQMKWTELTKYNPMIFKD